MYPVTRPLGQLASSLFMKKSDNFGLAAHTSQCGAGAHIRHHPECPAEGQSLQRGHVRNMPAFSLITRSTINTLQLSRSPRVHRRVYWLLALVPRRTLSRPADRLPDWSWRRSSRTHAQDGGAQQWHRRRDGTHCSTANTQRNKRKSDAQVLFWSSRDAR